MTSSDHGKNKYTQEAPCEICGKGKVQCHEDHHIQKGCDHCASRIEIPQVMLLELRIGGEQKDKEYQSYEHFKAYELRDYCLPLVIQPGHF